MRSRTVSRPAARCRAILSGPPISRARACRCRSSSSSGSQVIAVLSLACASKRTSDILAGWTPTQGFQAATNASSAISLRRWAGERPDRHFLEFEDGSAWTFARDAGPRRSTRPRGCGPWACEQGSHVLCWMPNAAEAVLAWLAANYLGAVHVPINTGYRGRLLQHAIELSDARVMVAHASLLPRLREIETAQLQDVVVVGGVPADIGPTDAATASTVLHTPERAEPSRPVEPWDPNFIILTSGTTGPSKAVISTYIQTWCGGAMGMDYFDADDRVLANLPLFHISGAGAVMDRLTKGGTCILLRRLQARDVLGHGATVRDHRVLPRRRDDAVPAAAAAERPRPRSSTAQRGDGALEPGLARRGRTLRTADAHGVQHDGDRGADPVRRQPGGARHVRPAARGRRGARRGWRTTSRCRTARSAN